jgi:CxxC-x17-CxxC domain-containing protein
MEFTHKTLICVTCAEEFVFSAGEQMFFSAMRFQHEPKLCKKCRAKLRNVRTRVEASVNCAECDISTIVPFVPREGRPVLCRSCFDRALREASIRPGGASSHPSKQV